MSSVATSIKKFHIQYDLHLIYKQSFYRDKQDETNELFDEYHLPLLKDIDHPAFIEEWKQNIDTADYEKNQNKKKTNHQRRKKFIVIVALLTDQQA